FIKGSRLHLYPKGVRIYRTSRNISRPIIIHCSELEAQKRVENQKLVYMKSIDIIGDDGSIINRIRYRQYNKNRKE
ncbi:MAG: hypothetical protein RSF73_09185, partial [Ruthenibacterium sp.]